MLVLPIGGADMPVVISLLNAFTGLSAAAAGIALDNVALIVAGMLVGASGSILTQQMADAMNRSIANIFAGGFGGVSVTPGAGADGEQKPVRSTDAADVAIQLAYASKVVVAPGYGMAVAQAQHTVRELADELEKRGIRVDYAIHPVAGRMPGHMNVLLAEADVPYDPPRRWTRSTPTSRDRRGRWVGANDVTNPAAPRKRLRSTACRSDVDKANQVIVRKRSMNTGFAGIDKPASTREHWRACSATRRSPWPPCWRRSRSCSVAAASPPRAPWRRCRSCGSGPGGHQAEQGRSRRPPGTRPGSPRERLQRRPGRVVGGRGGDRRQHRQAAPSPLLRRS